MENPSSIKRRRAWINSSRHCHTMGDVDPGILPPILDDDVFSDGCSTGKIENWLLSCRSGARSENSCQLSLESGFKANHFDDELSLGDDASVFNGGEFTPETDLTQQPSFRHARLTSTPRQALCLLSMNLGHSMASSCLSSSTCKTTSSISEVLQLCSEDAEETLYELGFGCDEPQVTVRIPPRFFTFPSLAQGINFRLFLDSQLRRIREEDPSLSLASRFRQVQVLTAMANAFYSLYSHVSRTPLQKLATPQFTFSSSPVERIERFRSSVRSEPRSPVERLKDTVSKMCLYTGSPRGSDSNSPQASPKKRSSLPDVVDTVLENSKTRATKKLDLWESKTSNSAEDTRLVMEDDKSHDSGKEERQSVMDRDTLNNGNKICHKETDNAGADENSIEGAGRDSKTQHVRTSLASSLSGETVIKADHQFISCQPEPDTCSSQSDARAAHPKPAAKVAYDLICPPIVESVHQAPFCTLSPKTSTLSPVYSETERIERSCPGSHIQTDKNSHASASTSPPLLASEYSFTQCCITVTGWEVEDVSPCSLNAPDSCHASTVPPAQTCEESFNKGKSQYLNPPTHQGLGHISNNLRQVNSFELEEVHSAGEEDLRQSETTTTSPLSKNCHYKGEVVRGDSIGYTDEEVSLSHR